MTVVVTAPGYVPSRSFLATDDHEVIVLQKATPRTGTVRSAAGVIEGATVAFRDMWGDVVYSAQTDAAGKYSAPSELFRSALLCASHPSFAPSCAWPAGEHGQMRPASADVTLVEGSAITGRVLDTDRRPVSGASIHAGRWKVATSGEDGSFTARNVGKDMMTITAISATRSGSAEWTSSPVTITLEEGRIITGSVLDASGKPLSGYPVIATSESREDDQWASGVSDAKGAYRVVVPAGKYSVYVVAPPTIEFEVAEADVRRTESAARNFKGAATKLARGIVIDENKQPVAGAVVSLSIQEMPVVYMSRNAFAASAMTDPEGRFRLPVAAERKVRLIALKPGFAAAATPEIEADAMRSKAVTITLPRGVAVRGVVADAGGKPQAGVAITAMTATGGLNAVPLGSALATEAIDGWTTTAADGTFTINLNPGTHDIGAWKRGFAATNVAGVDVTAKMEPVRVVLEPAAEIRGRITRKSGAAPGAGMVMAVREDNRGAGQAMIESDGSFVITSLSPGTYMLVAQVEGAGMMNRMVDAPSRDVIIELSALSRVAGRVIDAESGAPIARYDVTASDQNADFFKSETVSDASGAFTIDAPVGTVEIDVAADGYTSASQHVTVESEKGVAGIEIALKRGRRISGRVTNSAGAGIAEVDVMTRVDDAPAYARTDDTGEYEIEGAPRGEVTVGFRKSGFVTVQRPLPAGDGDSRIDVVMNSGRKINGRVVDAAGKGVADARVSATSEAHGADSQSATSDAAGNFTIEGLVPAHYDLRAEKEGAGQGRLEDFDITSNVPITLRLDTRAAGRIRGTVTGAGSDWMSGFVQATGESDSAHGTIGRDGKFVIENAPLGEVRVAAMFMSAHRESSTPAVTVHVSQGVDAEVNLAAGDGFTVGGAVTAEGQPMNGASVSFRRENNRVGGQWRSTSSQDGRYEVSGLEAGVYTIDVVQPGRSPFRIRREINASTTIDIDVAHRRLEGQVVDPTGAGLPSANVNIALSEQSGYQRPITVTTRADGRFSVAVQPGVTYSVTASKSGYASSTTSVDGSAPAAVRLELTPSEGTIVRLVDARSGATLSGYVVVREAVRDVQIPVSHEEQGDGSLRLPLPPGQYRVSVSANGYASQTVRTTIPGPEVRVALTPGGTVVIHAAPDAKKKVRFVLPDGEEYVRCYCNGIAEIRLDGAVTRVENVAPGSYRMEVLDGAGKIEQTHPVVVIEGQPTSVDATK